MNKLMLSMLGSAALALCACGDSERLHTLPDETPAPAQKPEPAGRRFELRLRGENPGDLGAALLPVRGFRVFTPEGAELPVRLTATRALHLHRTEHAHLVGHFYVPEGVGRVQVTLAFDDYGGYEAGTRAGAIDARVAPLRFEAPVDYLRQRGRAVVHLDLASSLQPTGEAEGQRLLMPDMTVQY